MRPAVPPHAGGSKLALGAFARPFKVRGSRFEVRGSKFGAHHKPPKSNFPPAPPPGWSGDTLDKPWTCPGGGLHSVGGNCNAFTSFDETCYHETLPAQQLELALWLEAERMAFLTVDGAGFSTERKVVEEERRLDLGLPYGEIADKGPPLVFGQHPYGHDPLGTFQDLRKATPADVHAWWTRWYTPNNATLVIVGDVPTDRVRALCERYFGWNR